MPAEKRQTFWFADEDAKALDKLVERLQRRSIVKVSKAAGLRWAIDAANKELEVMDAGEVLTDQRESSNAQIEAAIILSKAEKQYVPLAYDYLLSGLEKHLHGYGPVQAAIVIALRQIGDERALPYLEKLRSVPPEDKVLLEIRKTTDTLQPGSYSRGTYIKLDEN